MFTYNILTQAFKHILSPFEDGKPELNAITKQETLPHQPYIRFPIELKRINLFAKRESRLYASSKTLLKHTSCH